MNECTKNAKPQGLKFAEVCSTISVIKALQASKCPRQVNEARSLHTKYKFFVWAFCDGTCR